MTRRNMIAQFLVCACFVLAAFTAHASAIPGRHLMAHHNFKGRVLDRNVNSPRLKAARAEAAAELRGVVTPRMLAESSSSSPYVYNLYVGCTTSPAGETYSTIQDAVAAALPYTTISICPGIYLAGGASTGITVSTSYVKIKGVAPHSGSETVYCDPGSPDPTDDSFGFYLNGSNDTIENLTIEDCSFGVYSGSLTEVKGTEVMSNWFNGDYDSIESYFGYKVEIEGQ
jgi:hypothetical protein